MKPDKRGILVAKPLQGGRFEFLQHELDTHRAAQQAKKARLSKDSGD
jgi:hypothetical protein